MTSVPAFPGATVTLRVRLAGEVASRAAFAMSVRLQPAANPVRGVVEVTEVTRGGAVVRTARFMASRVLALVEHPAARRPGQEPDRGTATS